MPEAGVWLVKKHTLLVVLTVAIYLMIVFGGRILFSATAGSDSQTVADMADSGQIGLGAAYAMTALIYSYTPDFLRQILVLCTGIAFIRFCVRRASTMNEAIAMSFLCLAPSIMAIGTFQKDMLLVWFILPVAIVCLEARRTRVALLVFVAVYLLYALTFRQYYLVIVFVSLLAFAFARSGPVGKIIIAALVVAGLMMTPVQILYLMQAPRDAANFNRIYVDGGVVARTAFMNPYKITGLGPFLMNYLYSFWALDFSLFKTPGVRQFYLLLNLIGYYGLMIWGFASGDRRNTLIASIIFGHVATLHLFDPDSGSYLRHISSTLPLVAVLMARRRMSIRDKTRHEATMPSGIGQPT